MHPAECELVAMDGTGHTSDYADKILCTNKRQITKKRH